MDLIAQYEIPYLHPLAVHFPLVLLLLGAAAAAGYTLLGRGVWRRAALVLFLLGTASAWAAERTGHDLAAAVEGEPVVDQIVGRHEAAAEWTVLVSAFAAFTFTGLSLLALVRRRPAPAPVPEAEGEPAPPPPPPSRPRREPLWGRLLALVPALAAAALVAWTAHLGAIMVWGVPR